MQDYYQTYATYDHRFLRNKQLYTYIRVFIYIIHIYINHPTLIDSKDIQNCPEHYDVTDDAKVMSQTLEFTKNTGSCELKESRRQNLDTPTQNILS